jgi:hypothetical protein
MTRVPDIDALAERLTAATSYAVPAGSTVLAPTSWWSRPRRGAAPGP